MIDEDTPTVVPPEAMKQHLQEMLDSTPADELRKEVEKRPTLQALGDPGLVVRVAASGQHEHRRGFRVLCGFLILAFSKLIK